MANDIIKLKRGTATQWTASGHVLEVGEVGIETDTNKMKIGDGTAVWKDIDYTTKAIEDEVGRLKTDISSGTSILPVFAWRGKGLPPIPSNRHRAYYIHITVLKDSNGNINLPVNAPEDCIFALENNDRTDYVTVYPPSGETINGLTTSFQSKSDTLSYFVKSGKDWVEAFGGVFPNSMDSFRSTAQALLSTQLHTMDEIAAQFKDRFHTFREIQTEFKDQLHTYDDLEANGFSRSSYQYGTLPDQTVPHDDNSWIKGSFPINEEKVIPFVNEGDKYLAFIIPSFLTPLISELQINSTPMGFEDHDYLYNELHYSILITDSTITTGSNVRVRFNFSSSGGGSPTTGIEIDDSTSDSAGIVKINTKGMKITELPSQGSMTSGEIELTAGMDIHMSSPNQQYGNALCNELIVEPPMKVDDTPSGDYTAKLYIDHDAYEPMHKPSFLAYIGEDEEVVGKLPQGGENTAKSHHDGSLWFDNVVWPAGEYIETDRTNKKYGIQEADQLDPNVTGGTDYLIAFRVHMKGKAPSDGFVRAYLYNDSIDPFEPKGYLNDKNGSPMAVQRVYKTGDELGYLDVIGVVNAKGLQEFTCHVVDTFTGDVLILTDRTEGCTGLMIQALTSESKSGVGLLQFEADTNQNIEFSSHYLGVDRMNLGFINSRPESPVSYTAGTNFISVDGWRLINPNGIKVGVVDDHTHIQDDGVHLAEFNYGRVFSAEETHLLRGKDINVSATLVDKDNGFVVGLMKWTGTPDKFTPKIFTTRNNGSPICQTGWSLSDKMFISEDAVSGDHTQARTFVVPSDANNYAIIIYPTSVEAPMVLRLKELKVDVDPAFTGYVIQAPELLDELHLRYDTEYKELIQDNQGYASLRYTITDSELPMPVGEFGKGLADITLDTTVNKIAGSQARGGEGAILFNTDGEVTIHTALRISSEKAKGTTSRITFWYAKVIGKAGSETYDAIADSEHEFDVSGGDIMVQHYMPAFKLRVDAGDRIALRVQGDSYDSAFISSDSPSRPMVKTSITFKELVAEGGDDPNAVLDATRAAIESAGGTIYPASLVASQHFAASNSAVINLSDLPSGAKVNIMSVDKVMPDGTTHSISKYETAFDEQAGTLTVSFFENAETIIIYEVLA